MKCPVCKKVPEDFREHALNHVRDDEGYAIETWDHVNGEARLDLCPIAGPLNRERVKNLKRMLGQKQSLIYGGRLRQIERKQRTG